MAIRIEIAERVPSLNRLFGLNPWARKKLKEETFIAVASALLAKDVGCSTQITCASNILLMRSVTAKSSKTTPRKKLKSTSSKKKSKRGKKRKR